MLKAPNHTFIVAVTNERALFLARTYIGVKNPRAIKVNGGWFCYTAIKGE